MRRREFFARTPAARVEIVEGVGRLVHMEAERRFNAILLGFLDDR